MNRALPTFHILWSPPAEQTGQDCACAAETAVFPSSPTCPETDCACSTASVLQRGRAGNPRRWQQTPLLYRTTLPDGHELLLPHRGPVGPVVLNETARSLLASFAQSGPLESTAARQLATLGLLVPLGVPQPALCPAPETHTLTAWLHVTNACNLSCSYCYVHTDGAPMDGATGRAALEAIFGTAARQRFGAVKLKYAGGEPTLNFDRVRLLHEQASLLAQSRGLALWETLMTNGVALSDEVLGFVAAAGLRLAISLDASRRAHDARRTLPNGGGTFDQVRRNVRRALQWGLRPYLSITLSGDEGEQPVDAIDLALELDLPFNLNFVRPARGRPSPATAAGQVAAVRTIFSRIEARLPRPSLLAVLDRADFGHPHAHACGAGRSYLVIDHCGRISPCQMDMARPAGDLHVEDPLAAVQAAFPHPSVEDQEHCASCPWRYGCAGGCPWLARQASENLLDPSPYCPAYRVLFPELLRLEGLRLLKWGAQN